MCRFIQTKGRLVVSRTLMLNDSGYRVSFWGNKNSLNLTVVMVTQL